MESRTVGLSRLRRASMRRQTSCVLLGSVHVHLQHERVMRAVEKGNVKKVPLLTVVAFKNRDF